MIKTNIGQETLAENGALNLAENRKFFIFHKFSERSLSIRIFLACWLIFVLHFATNTVREIYPALSLGDSFSFDVSEYKELHPDIFEIKDRGAFINNNPGASILGAVPYILFRPAIDLVVARVQTSRAVNPQPENADYNTIYTLSQEFYRKAREKGLDVKFGLAAAVMQAFLMAPISALGVVVMFWLMLSVTKNRRTSVFLALLFAVATPILYRTAQLNQNLLVANFALFSFALLWRPWNAADSGKKPFYFLAGLCAGWTVVLDYSGLAVVAALSFYVFLKWHAEPVSERQLQSLLKFGGGIALCAMILMFYQWSSFGNPIFPAQSYMPQANFTELGYRGFSFPQPDLLYQTAFGMRYGLFTSAPILLCALFVPVWLRKSSRFFAAPELVFIIVFTIMFFIFCAANQYGRMQFNSGVRHIVPVVPFMFLLAANVLMRLPKIVAVLIGILAAYWSWCLAMYRDVEQGLGIFESIKSITTEGFRLPWLTTLERMGFVQNASPIPLLLLCGIFIWVLFNVSGKRLSTEF